MQQEELTNIIRSAYVLFEGKIYGLATSWSNTYAGPLIRLEANKKRKRRDVNHGGAEVHS